MPYPPNGSNKNKDGRQSAESEPLDSSIIKKSSDPTDEHCACAENYTAIYRIGQNPSQSPH
jgi:hypothetical protein